MRSYEYDSDWVVALFPVPYVGYAIWQLSYGADVTGDGAFTISDVWQTAWLAFTDPGMFVQQHLAASKSGDFFEVAHWSPDGWAVVLISGVAWLMAAILPLTYASMAWDRFEDWRSNRSSDTDDPTKKR